MDSLVVLPFGNSYRCGQESVSMLDPSADWPSISIGHRSVPVRASSGPGPEFGRSSNESNLAGSTSKS